MHLLGAGCYYHLSFFRKSINSSDSLCFDVNPNDNFLPHSFQSIRNAHKSCWKMENSMECFYNQKVCRFVGFAVGWMGIIISVMVIKVFTQSTSLQEEVPLKISIYDNIIVIMAGEFEVQFKYPFDRQNWINHNFWVFFTCFSIEFFGLRHLVIRNEKRKGNLEKVW